MNPVRALCAALPLLVVAPAGHATTFCVGTSAQLQAALDTAADNGADDTIKIKSGTYTVASGSYAFSFGNQQSFDLGISGGWVDVGMLPCLARFDDPGLTVLSGSGVRGVLVLQGSGGTSGAMSVENLTLRDGNTNQAGAGLKMGVSGGYTGDLRVERVFFDNNVSEANGGGAVISSDGGVVIVRNNLFRDNHCGANSCAAVILANFANTSAVRTFIGNNTVVVNSCSNGAPDTCNTGGFGVQGTARASVYNNAFAFNGGNDLRLAGTSIDLLYNNINAFIGVAANNLGNKNLFDPGFVAPLVGDFHLLTDSPLRNGGVSGFELGALDFDGLERVNDGQVDIGAYENDDVLFRSSFEDQP